MAERRRTKTRRKWTKQMNIDLLNCKRNAVEMAQMEQPLLDDKGKKKGYIKIMKELWDAKGYKELGFSSQNLRDQAARLESQRQNSENLYGDTQAHENSRESSPNITLSDNGGIENESQYANLRTTTNPDLHSASTQQIPREEVLNEDSENARSIPGCLPEYKVVDKPCMVTSGESGVMGVQFSFRLQL